jgi:hypothetical protein
LWKNTNGTHLLFCLANVSGRINKMFSVKFAT